ncbi:MAG: OmpA family protein [Planctomycetota bacterium]
MSFARTLRRALAVGLVGLSVASCANTRAYDEQVRLAEALQLQNDELSAYTRQLEGQLETLRRDATGYPVAAAGEAQGVAQPASAVDGGSPADEAAGADDTAEQLAEIQARIDALNALDGEVVPVLVEGGYGFSLAESVVFDSGSTEVRAEGVEVLERLATGLLEEQFAAVWVRGHSDGLPVRRAETLTRFPGGNLEISVERALSVAAILKSAGLAEDEVLVAGFGPTRPIADNGTAEGRASNRRVEIFVLEDAAAADARGGL